MIRLLTRKLFGSANDRRVRKYQPRVDAINALEKELTGLSDEALRARTEAFRKQVADGTSLDDLLVPALGPHLGRRRQEELQLRIGEDDRADVAPLDDATAVLGGPLPLCLVAVARDVLEHHWRQDAVQTVCAATVHAIPFAG